MKVNLTYVKNDEVKESKKIDPKTEKPYTYFFCSIRCKELVGEDGKELWLNGFGDDTTKQWEEKKMADREGTLEADLHIYDETYKEKVYKKFKRTASLTEKDRMQIEIDELKAKTEPKAGPIVETPKEEGIPKW